MKSDSLHFLTAKVGPPKYYTGVKDHSCLTCFMLNYIQTKELYFLNLFIFLIEG